MKKKLIIASMCALMLAPMVGRSDSCGCYAQYQQNQANCDDTNKKGVAACLLLGGGAGCAIAGAVSLGDCYAVDAVAYAACSAGCWWGG